MTNFNLTFKNSYFRTTLLLIVFFELLSFFTNWFNLVLNLNSLFFLLLVFSTFGLALYRLELGLYIALTELFIGSQGHLFDLELFAEHIPIRMGLFSAILLAWLYHSLKNKNLKVQFTTALSYKALCFLALVCLWALVFALARKTALTNIFHDFNAWLYFLYFLPLILIFRTSAQLQKILHLFLACVTSIGLKSILFLFIFSHKLPIMFDFYRWGRDTRWGEFTAVNEFVFRIFSQAQIFVLLGFFIGLAILLFSNQQLNKKNWLLLAITILSGSTILLSLSRSFWLGTLLTLFFLALIIIIAYKINFKSFLQKTISFLIITALSLILLTSVTYFPWPRFNHQLNTGGLSERLNLNGAAVSSRWSQLPHLLPAIAKHPILGSGWGQTITYQSQDPRILTATNPQGWYTTYAFEWGYLDLILKIGLLGLIVYLTLLLSLFRQLRQIWQKNKDPLLRALTLGFTLALLALMIVHGFSPYLNHPLGIGFVLLLITMINILHQTKTEPINPG